MEILRTQHLSKYFGKFCALREVDLHVMPGKKTSVIGPNGAGKTTLFNLISGLFPPDGGTIYFENHDISGLTPHEISCLGISRSFQLTNVFPGLSVFENVRLAVQRKWKILWKMWKPVRRLKGINEETLDILNGVELYESRNTFAKNLSHGAAKHLEIAITYASNPKLIMLDEPTAGMSPAEKKSTIDLINKLSEGLSILLIEHDIGLVMSISDSIAVLHHGSLIAHGFPEDIKNDKSVQEAYLGEM
jgi:branched-chain amino acid transport system ATP-binding protein